MSKSYHIKLYRVRLDQREVECVTLSGDDTNSISGKIPEIIWCIRYNIIW